MLPSWVSPWCYQQNVRLDWKVIASYKNSSLFGLIIIYEGKTFYNIDTRISNVSNDGTLVSNKCQFSTFCEMRS
jgi:hypothetical protein